MPGGWGFRFVQIRGSPFLDSSKGQNKENFDKYSSHEPRTGWNTLIFTMAHPLGKEIQGCSNKVPRVMYSPTSGA